jgi:hypothetical protein
MWAGAWDSVAGLPPKHYQPPLSAEVTVSDVDACIMSQYGGGVLVVNRKYINMLRKG